MIRLKDARRLKGLKQQQVADYLGIAKVTYARYEGGTREPDIDTLVKLSALFDVTVDYLLGLTDIPNIYMTTGVGKDEGTVFTVRPMEEREKKHVDKEIAKALSGGSPNVTNEMRELIKQLIREVKLEDGIL